MTLIDMVDLASRSPQTQTYVSICYLAPLTTIRTLLFLFVAVNSARSLRLYDKYWLNSGGCLHLALFSLNCLVILSLRCDTPEATGLGMHFLGHI